ncbi:MAG: hypothetical protein OXN17_15610 [Candidatus Poribacteria bacterium]|nr:hypothetical protein [Candidatus Poribacteria bacterium]MDE0503962.1 hypothetical protein [Candidatus Poribacteria bacterium]
MKQQTGFDRHKFLTISMVVVGVGFFLFSLIFTRLRFNTELPKHRITPDSEIPPATQTSSRDSFERNEGLGNLQDSVFPDEAPVSEALERQEWEDSLLDMLDEETAETSESEEISESQEERFFGLTRAEIEARIPVLEEEIRTNLTKAVELYAELGNTDGMAGDSPEIAAWRDETWAEVKRLFHEVSNTGIILRYVTFMDFTGRGNPLDEGEWISELIEPLPMRVNVTLYDHK